jgi:hypothetical protein
VILRRSGYSDRPCSGSACEWRESYRTSRPCPAPALPKGELPGSCLPALFCPGHNYGNQKWQRHSDVPHGTTQCCTMKWHTIWQWIGTMSNNEQLWDTIPQWVQCTMSTMNNEYNVQCQQWIQYDIEYNVQWVQCDNEYIATLNIMSTMWQWVQWTMIKMNTMLQWVQWTSGQC